MNAASAHPESFDRSQIERVQLEKLGALLQEISASNTFWKNKFKSAGVDPTRIASLDDLQQLPLTTKAELVDDQAAHPPYGTNLTYHVEAYSRLHQTSGTTGTPMRWLDTRQSWDWFTDCWAQIYRMAGVEAADRIAFPFSFGPFVGFWAAFEGASRLGNLCLPGGGMSSEARLQMIADNSATVVCCTPTYALRLAEVAREQGVDLTAGTVRLIIVAGEPGGSIPATRQRIEQAWGARLIDHWGMTEIGALAVECIEHSGGIHMLETECIAEILDPKTGEPADPGEQGELIVTNLGRLGSPLIRYRTGDLVQADTKPCPCGRQLLRLEGGVLGRADDMVIIRGNNVYPSSLEAILRRFDEIAEYRVEVATVRSMQQLRVEVEPTGDVAGDRANVEQLVGQVARAIKDGLNFNAEVAAVECGSLPRFELKGRRFIRRDD